MENTNIIYKYINSLLHKKSDKSTGNKEQQSSADASLENQNKELKSIASTLKVENNELKANISSLQKQITSDSEDASKRIEAIKSKYEALLKEAKEQVEELDKQLKNTINGNVEDVVKDKLEEVEKLKKKIKLLEKEIEENEEDFEDKEKEFKNKERKYQEREQILQNELYKEQQDKQNLDNKLKDLKEKLANKVEELDLKMGSINFIQEILSAKKISTADTKKLDKNIDFLEGFVKGQFTRLNSFLYTTFGLTFNNIEGNAGFECKKKYFWDNFDQWAATKRKSWLDGKTTIAFVGEFSAGKTSIVNRILSQDNPDVPKLPVSTKATTAIPTYIAGGSTVSYSFISGDGKRKTILEETFKKVSKEVLDQIKGVSSLIKYFVMTYKNPNLEGLSILDTPGFNSNDSEDGERTIDVINECDALFWVFDVNNGTINRGSISIIKEKLNKPLFVVINKVDTKSESEIQGVEYLIKNTLADAGLKVEQFIRFSKKVPLDQIMKPIKTVKKNAQRDTFISDIKSDLEDLSQIFDNGVKEANQSYHAAYNQGEDTTNKYSNKMQTLCRECQEAVNIPHWEEHIFGSDRYEMRPDEYNKLKNILERIAGKRMQELADLYNKRVEDAHEIQSQWDYLTSLKSAWQQIRECTEQYNKIIKNLN